MKTFLPIFFLFIFSCKNDSPSQTVDNQVVKINKVIEKNPENEYPWKNDYNSKDAIINQIATPNNYNRISTRPESFQNWLQFLPLFAKEKKVKLHNGDLKYNQNVHHRVVNVDVGKRDLQQCADAVMRMRSEYLFSKKKYNQIHFNYTNGTKVSYEDWRNGKRPKVQGNNVTFTEGNVKDDSYGNFKKYLIQIFTYAGTASLEKEMKSISMKEMKIGDVLIQGGHPGHAVLVIDMCENSDGEKLFLLAQSYMPAQEFHILKNPSNKNLNPWYELKSNGNIKTPEWTFSSKDLKRF